MSETTYGFTVVLKRVGRVLQWIFGFVLALQSVSWALSELDPFISKKEADSFNIYSSLWSRHMLSRSIISLESVILFNALSHSILYGSSKSCWLRWTRKNTVDRAEKFSWFLMCNVVLLFFSSSSDHERSFEWVQLVTLLVIHSVHAELF